MRLARVHPLSQDLGLPGEGLHARRVGIGAEQAATGLSADVQVEAPTAGICKARMKLVPSLAATAPT